MEDMQERHFVRRQQQQQPYPKPTNDLILRSSFAQAFSIAAHICYAYTGKLNIACVFIG